MIQVEESVYAELVKLAEIGRAAVRSVEANVDLRRAVGVSDHTIAGRLNGEVDAMRRLVEKLPRAMVLRICAGPIRATKATVTM